MLNSKSQKKILVSLFFFCAVFLSNSFAQQNKRIEIVDIQGNRRMTDKEIFAYIKTRPHQSLDEKQLQ